MEESDIVQAFDAVKLIYNFDFILKNEQIAVLQGLLSERNVFALLPTGYGKSMCFVLPPLLLDEMDWTVRHLAVVVSPLKALMADQVRELAALGVNSIAVEPDMPQRIHTDIKNGKYSVMFISPEMATSKIWRSIFLSSEMQSNICVFACDEAHCISEWGEDFRPSYKDVICLRSVLEKPVLAISATCDEHVRKEIFSSLALSNQDTLTVSIVPDRPNIFLDIRKSKQNHEEDLKWLLDYLAEMQTSAKKIIVYCRTVKGASMLYNHVKDELRSRGATEDLVDMFHRSIDRDSYVRITEGFKSTESRVRCLFSTVAFGMGIQIPDVDIIVHWGVPKSVLCYWQEVGRAGRGGNQAYAICYAYGRSLIPTATDREMIRCAQSGIGKNECIRVTVLRAMTINGMETLLPEKDQCNGCLGRCKCKLCLCCSTCLIKCPCENKENIGSHLGVLL